MSLYRQAGESGRQAFIVGVVALLAGLGIGYLLGASQTDEPSFEEAVTQLRSDMAPVTNGLELLGVEYPQGVNDGEVDSQSEYEGSVSNVGRIQATVEENLDDLSLLDPEATLALAAAVEELRVAVVAKGDPSAVNRLRARAVAELRSILPAPEATSGPS